MHVNSFRPRGLRRAAVSSLLLALAFVAACTSKGEYRITWTFSTGDITGSGDCSRHGVEAVEVRLENLSTGAVTTNSFPCSQASSGIQTLDDGLYRLQIQALGPGGVPFVDPVSGGVAMLTVIEDFHLEKDGPMAELDVTFTPNPACADLIDNDGDGLVDAGDPGCWDRNGDYQASGDDETNDESPATLAVSWLINGGEGCDDVQPGGAQSVSLWVDGFEVGRFDCIAGAGEVPLSAGEHGVTLNLVDASGLALAETQSATTTLVQDLRTELDFDFGPDTFDPPQTGAFDFFVSWVADASSCGDASPMIIEQRLLLVDDLGATVDATTLAGTAVDGSSLAVGECRDATEPQGLQGFVPVGSYVLTVTGLTAGGDACWTAAFPGLTVGLGPNDAFELVVPQTDATGNCAP